MEGKAKVLGHPIHPMLIVFPVGLLATAVAFDIVGLIYNDASWFGISFWMIAAGILGGLLSAVFGLIDRWAISVNGSVACGSRGADKRSFTSSARRALKERRMASNSIGTKPFLPIGSCFAAVLS